MTYWDDLYIECHLCRQRVIKRALHPHMQSATCITVTATCAAEADGYVYDRRIANVSQARWAESFCRKYRTGFIALAVPKAEDRTWAIEWWWNFYKATQRLPAEQDRIALLEKVEKLWHNKEVEEINDIIAGVELACEGV